MNDVALLNNPLSYPYNQMAGQKLGYECFVTKENYVDNLHKIKQDLVKKINNEFDFRNRNTSIKLSEDAEFEFVAIKGEFDFKVTAVLETVFI
jgi:hypothetical protein